MRRKSSSENENNFNKKNKKPMMMQMQPETPYLFYPPGTVYNPIGVPPGAGTPGMMPISPTPIVTPPGRGVPTMPPAREVPGVPETEVPIDFDIQPGPPVLTNTEFLQGYLRTIIGRYVKIDFLIGTNTFIDREGTLIDVGVDHVVLREAETDDLLVCDLYSIKFVKVYF